MQLTNNFVKTSLINFDHFFINMLPRSNTNFIDGIDFICKTKEIQYEWTKLFLKFKIPGRDDITVFE